MHTHTHILTVCLCASSPIDQWMAYSLLRNERIKNMFFYLLSVERWNIFKIFEYRFAHGAWSMDEYGVYFRHADYVRSHHTNHLAAVSCHIVSQGQSVPCIPQQWRAHTHQTLASIALAKTTTEKSINFINYFVDVELMLRWNEIQNKWTKSMPNTNSMPFQLHSIFNGKPSLIAFYPFPLPRSRRLSNIFVHDLKWHTKKKIWMK